MQLKGILAGALLLVIYAVACVPTIDLGNWWIFHFAVANPIYLVFTAPLLKISTFTLTLAYVFLGLAIICLLMGLFTSGKSGNSGVKNK